MEAEITQFPHGRMSAEQFDAERARLRGLYGDSRKEAGARYEQALARLFYVSGWTLNELAKKEGKGKSTVSQMLIFGRFLGFLETWNPPESSLSAVADKTENVPLGLTERRFRDFWLRTEVGSGSSGGNERIRFRDVMRLMQEDSLAPKTHRSRDLGKAVAAQFADGKWRDAATIAKHVEASEEDVLSVLQNIVDHRTFGCTAEKREFAKSYQYRIFPQERQVSTVELVEKLQPMLTILAEQGRANMATMSPPTVAHHTAKIQALLNEWSGRPAKKRR